MIVFDSAESYFYPETVDIWGDNEGTLRNLFGERDANVLRVREYGYVSERYRELRSGEVFIERTFDEIHLKAIHKYLFQDVYEWAGQFRTIEMEKGETQFDSIKSGEVQQRLVLVSRLVACVNWASLDHRAFVDSACQIFAELNIAHPFREGNGRASKVFMEHVAEQSCFKLHWENVSRECWNSWSELSAPVYGERRTNPEFLQDPFQKIAVPRAKKD